MSKKSHKKSSKPASLRAAGGKSAKVKTGPRTAAATPSRGKASGKSASKPLQPTAATPAPKAGPTAKPKATSSPAAPAAILAEGDKARQFRLPRDGGDSVSLQDFTGKKLVLFFYPKADTPGCTREAIDFTRLRDAFAETDAEVAGISADTVKLQEKFRDKHKLSVPLISDETHEMLQAYGAWGEKSMYGRKFLGIIRTTVLIGRDGRIARLWRNVRVDGHADEVLAAARAL